MPDQTGNKIPSLGLKINKTILRSQQSFRSEAHNIFTRKVNMTVFSASGDSSGPNFGPNLGRTIFLKKIWLCQSLDIMVNYHHAQYQEKLII